MRYEEDSIFLFNLLDLLLQQIENPLGIEMKKVYIIRHMFEEWKKSSKNKYEDISISSPCNEKILALENALSTCYPELNPSKLFLEDNSNEHIH